MAKMAEAKADKALKDIGSPCYRYWQALYLSFYCGRLYVDIGKRWKGLGIGYLFLLVCFAIIPLNLRIVFDFNRYYQQQVIEPLKKIPKLFIQEGIVTLDKPMPYLIKNRAGQTVLIIDTTGKVDMIDERNPNLMMLITRNQFLYHLPVPQFSSVTDDNAEAAKTNTDVYTQPFPKDMNQVFDGEEWLKSSGIERVKWISDLMMYPMLVSLFFVLFLIFFLVCTMMSQLVAYLFMKTPLTYKQACRLFIVSATPSITMLMLALAFNYTGKWLGPVIIIVFLAYFYLAVSSLKSDSKKLVVS